MCASPFHIPPPSTVWVHRPPCSTGGEGRPRAPQIQPLPLLSARCSALGTAHTRPGSSHVALPARFTADVWQVLALPTLMPHAEVCELHFQSSVLVRQAVSSLHCLYFMLQILNGSGTGGVSLDQDPLHLLHHRSLQHSTIPCYQPRLTT